MDTFDGDHRQDIHRYHDRRVGLHPCSNLVHGHRVQTGRAGEDRRDMEPLSQVYYRLRRDVPGYALHLLELSRALAGGTGGQRGGGRIPARSSLASRFSLSVLFPISENSGRRGSAGSLWFTWWRSSGSSSGLASAYHGSFFTASSRRSSAVEKEAYNG